MFGRNMTDKAAHFFSALHTTSNQRFIIYFTLAFWQAGVRKYIYVQRRSSWCLGRKEIYFLADFYRLLCNNSPLFLVARQFWWKINMMASENPCLPVFEIRSHKVEWLIFYQKLTTGTIEPPGQFRKFLNYEFAWSTLWGPKVAH